MFNFCLSSVLIIQNFKMTVKWQTYELDYPLLICATKLALSSICDAHKHNYVSCGLFFHRSLDHLKVNYAK